jgi:hypothetical protein
LTAFYRESRNFLRELHDYPEEAGEYPILLRLVELDGASEEVAVRLPGNVRYCYRTNLLGEPQESLAVASDGATVSFAMRPYEVATLVFESREYEKTARDLDSYREVWARSHKEGAENDGE